MSSIPKKDNAFEIILDTIRNITAVLGFAGGLSFVAGYLIVNFYLGKYGAASLNLVQARYFAAGATYLILSALISGLPLLVLYTINNEDKGEFKRNRGKLLLLLIASIFLSIVIAWASGRIMVALDIEAPIAKSLENRRVNLWLGLFGSVASLLFPLVAFLLVKQIWKKQESKILGNSAWAATSFSGFFVLFIIISLYVYGNFAYPNISPAIGGGAPMQARLILSETLYKHPGTPLPNLNGITDKVIILDQSGGTLLIEIPGLDEILEISSKDIVGILR